MRENREQRIWSKHLPVIDSASPSQARVLPQTLPCNIPYQPLQPEAPHPAFILCALTQTPTVGGCFFTQPCMVEKPLSSASCFPSIQLRLNHNLSTLWPGFKPAKQTLSSFPVSLRDAAWPVTKVQQLVWSLGLQFLTFPSPNHFTVTPSLPPCFPPFLSHSDLFLLALPKSILT